MPEEAGLNIEVASKALALFKPVDTTRVKERREKNISEKRNIKCQNMLTNLHKESSITMRSKSSN